MDLCNMNDIKALLARHGFHFSKSLGQNFLIQGWVPRDIAESSEIDETCGVVEIGPGIGPLTAQLAQRAGKVVSVELDKALLPILSETMAAYDNVEIVNGDIMKMDIPQLVRDKFPEMPVKVCANLPYNITTPVISAIIESKCFDSLTVMIQREVALRICAKPGTADYGAFTLFMQYYTQPELLFDVPPSCFLPQPKVTSSVIRCTMRTQPPVTPIDTELMFKLIRASFAMRRKTLVNGLYSIFSSQLSKEDLGAILVKCGFDANIRGEKLSLFDFSLLSDTLYNRLSTK